MKKLMIILFGILACLLIMDGLVLQPLMHDDSNAVYAMGHRDHRHPRRSRPPGPSQPVTDPLPRPDGPPHAVPEPTTLLLLGIGVSGISAYLYYRHRKIKK